MTHLLTKSFRTLAAIVFSLVVANSSVQAQTAVPGALPTAIVEMRSISFAPKTVTVREGQSVQWKNVSYTDHSATADDGGKSFDTNMIVPKDASKPVIFSKAGSYSYHCKMHGRTMSGIVIVNPAQ